MSTRLHWREQQALNRKLHSACKNGDIKHVQDAISRGARLESTDGRGDTALLIASENGNVEVVQTLSKAGAHLEATDEYRNTALTLASWNGHAEVVQTLIKAGAQLEATNYNRSTALMLASENGHAEVVQTLIKAGAQLEATNNFKNTALIVASTNGHAESVQTLIKAGARLEATNSNRSTALMLASGNGHAEVVQTLFKAGAQLEATNINGNTALMIAKKRGHAEVVQLLINAAPGLETTNLDRQDGGVSQDSSATLDSQKDDREPGGPPGLPPTTEAAVDSSVASQKESERLYNEAMKAGFVAVTTRNVLLFGMAGTGKTTAKSIILGRPPPKSRTSTALADSPERVHTIRDVSREHIDIGEDEWKPVTTEELQQIVFHTIKSLRGSIRDPPKDLDVALKQLESIEQCEIASEEGSSSPKSGKDESRSVPTGKSNQPVSADSEKGLRRNTNTFQKVISDIAGIMQAASLQDISHARKVLGSSWIYLIDSGGQPHFHNLLPLFVKEVSAALYVFRLSDMLDDRPLVAYFKDGDQKNVSFPSPLSTADNFRYLVQSIQSHPGDRRLVCIGTHLDTECQKEPKEIKNERLFELLPDSVKEKCLFFKAHHPREIIFPVDARKFDSEDTKSIAKKLRAAITQCPPQQINVPVWWYNFEIIIEKTSVVLGKQVFSMAECIEIAGELKFHVDALIEALKFFHKHHIFHYYPDVLPDLVFCTTQVLLDKVTELVERAAYLRGESGVHMDSGSDSVQGSELKLIDEGIITFEFLARFGKHYVEGLFGPAELIKIFDHLLIATPFDYIGQLQHSVEGVWKSVTLGELQSVVTDIAHSLGEKVPNLNPSQDTLTTLKRKVDVHVKSQPAPTLLSDESTHSKIREEPIPDIDTLLEMIISGKVKFFMPSLLGILSEAELEGIRNSLLKKGTPLVIHFRNGWPRCGVFCCLQVYLLKHGWILVEKPRKPKQNFVKLRLKDRACHITLIDCFTCFEVYAQDSETCFLVREHVQQGIHFACKALNYKDDEIKYGFLCPYNHRAEYCEKDKCLSCTLCEEEDIDSNHKLEDKHKAWLPKSEHASGSCRAGSGSLTIQSLKDKFELTDDQLNSEIAESDIHRLAGYFDNVEPFCMPLGLANAECADALDKKFRHGTRAGMTEALSRWRSVNPYSATYRKLLKILVDMEKENVADEVCKYLSSKCTGTPHKAIPSSTN